MVKLSEVAQAEEMPKKRRAYLDTSQKNNPEFGSFANKVLRKQATAAVDSIYDDEK